MTQENNFAVKARGLVKRYGELVAVDHVSLEIPYATIFGILGPNGAGKTSLIEMLEGMRPIDEGEAEVAGVDVRKQPADVRNRIGVLLQQGSFFDRLSLRELVELFGSFYGRAVDADQLLRDFGLYEKKNKIYRSLSGGLQQRFALALAFVNDPSVLFLDEPTQGLDPVGRRQVWDIIKQQKNKGTCVVITTHYMEEAQQLCDTVAIMDTGRILLQGNPLALVTNLKQSGYVNPNLEDVYISVTGKSFSEV